MLAPAIARACQHTAPFQFLGRGTQVSYSGERPISLVWALDHPTPAGLPEANCVGG